MAIEWDTTFQDNEGKISITGYSSDYVSDFKDYIENEFTDRIDYYSGKKSFKEIISNLAETDFETQTIEQALEQDVSYQDWGEYFAFDQIENHLNLKIPWPAAWDKRVEKASLPGADIVSFKYEEDNVIFVFGEIKTSSEERAPPTVVIKKNKGLIDQIKKLTNKVKITHLIQWLSLKSVGKDWEKDFQNAVKYYFKSNVGYCLLGLLIRDTDPKKNDLNCVFDKLKNISVSTNFYCFYAPINIETCMKICNEKGDKHD